MIWLGLVIGLFIGAILAILLYSCLIVAKEADERIEERTSIMNKKQAIAYAQMALHTIQNSANGDFKVKELNIFDFGEEIKIMFELYPLQEIEKKIERILLN